MRHLYILNGFMPWILFGVLSGHSLLRLDAAIIVSLVSGILFGYKELRRGFFLPWFTLLYFGFLLVTVTLMKNMWVIMHLGLLTNGALALIAWLSIVIRKPFTEQYAKLEVAKEFWNKPTFKNKNRLITAIWGLLLTSDLLIAYFFPDQGYIFTLLVMFFTILVGFLFTILVIEKYQLK